MSKLRVHDMAGEFGISADEVIALLRQMDVPVRSHLSLLTDDQVSRIRARWEREKRVRAEKAQPVLAAAPRRRRTGAAPEVPVPEVQTEAVAHAVRRRRRSESDALLDGIDAAIDVPVFDEVATANAAPSKPTVEPVAEEEPVSVELTVSVETVAEKPAHAEEQAVVEPPTPSTKAGDEAPPVAAAPELPIPVIATPAVIDARRPVAASAPAAPLAPIPAPASTTPVPVSLAPDRPRPRPVVPGAPRPRSGSGGSPNFGSARPIASAAPGGGLGQGQRRDDRRPSMPSAAGPTGGQSGQGGGQQGGQNTGIAASAQTPRRGKKGKRGRSIKKR